MISCFCANDACRDCQVARVNCKLEACLELVLEQYGMLCSQILPMTLPIPASIGLDLFETYLVFLSASQPGPCCWFAAAGGSAMQMLFGDLPSSALPAVSHSVDPSRATTMMTDATAIANITGQVASAVLPESA